MVWEVQLGSEHPAGQRLLLCPGVRKLLEDRLTLPSQIDQSLLTCDTPL